MTQAQYQWLKNNGYDPTVYDVDDQGNIFENPVQKPEVMSPLRAGLTSFAGSVLPTGGAMAASAPFMPLAAANPLVGVPVMLGAGLLGGYGTGKAQQSVLENYAPEAIAEMQRAEKDQPVASYLGGFAPNALAMRPSVKGLSGLLRPTAGGPATLREALTRPEFLAPAMNVGANVAGSTAGQLINMSEGGEFSAPRFAADVALGTLFNKPTALGRAIGFQDLPDNTRLPDPDLAEARARKQTIPTQTAEVLSPESVGVGQQRRALNAPRFDESGRLINQPFADVEIDLSPEGVGRQPGALERPFIEAEPAQRQLPNEGRKQLGYDPEQREAFIADKADESLENAFKQLEGPAEDRPAAPALTEDAKAAQDLLNEAKQTGNQENIAAAQEIYDDISKRFSRAGEEASNSITQEDINRANEIANRRGLKIELERAFADDGQEVRGMFLVDKKTGDRVIRINPFMATADTAIHEIGHDVFRGVTSKGMRRSLMDTAIDSPAFKSELAARQDEVRAGRITEQQARDIALEEGLIQAFGERLPNVSRGELRQWFAAFKANIKRITTGKMSPEDALAWMDYATTEAVPWKGVAVAKGGEERMQRAQQEGFNPLEKDIRYQRGPVGKTADAVKGRIDKTLGEIDQITRRGGIYETVGRAMTRAYNTADSMLGKARSLGTSISKLSYGDAAKLTSHLYNEYRNQQLITPAPEIAAAYNEWRTQAKPFWVNEANKAGHQIRSGKGLRDRIESEFWLPGQKESDEVREILSSKVGTPEYQKLKDDYLRDATDDYLSKGMQQNKAQEKALADFEERRALINQSFDPSAPANFAGARKPMGRPLPESWIEKDFRKVFENYNRRSAKDYASQEHFEKSPEVMAALGSKKFFNDQDIPANVLQNTNVIAPDPSVQSVMREFSGQPLQMPGKTVRSFGSMASALALQTISRIGDVGGTVTKPLAYIGLGDYGAYMGGMAEKLSNWSKLQARSIESGLNNPNAHQNFRQVVGMGEDAGKYMQKVLDGLGFITGSSKIESIARTLAQAQGEMIVSINKRKALTGDKDAVRFLDTLNADWRTQSDMALAAQFGQMMQGTYDMRQLPAWFLEGGAAPYLTWSKWSMGQMNNFRKFAVEPAMQGNLKPLIAQVLVGMAGGGAIEQIQEWLNNKESKAVNWSELESWAKQNEGKIGTDGGELLMQKLMMMAQKTGTFGFAGDLAMMPINALVGDTQSAVGVFPAAELATDVAKNLAGAITAIDKGEDVGLVLKRFGKNVIVGKTQMLRVANNWVDEIANEGTENLRSADRRKMRLFEELSGTGRSNGMFPVSYENLGEQEFERGSVTEKTGEEAFNLVKTARESATTREDYASRIRKYKTSQNQIMPSLERQPMKAARYLSFVEGADEGAGAETMRRYMTREYENKYRKSLIEGMSGLR